MENRADENTDEHSIDEIIDRYGTELSVLAFSYVRDIEASKDIVQNVFIKCYTHLHTFQGKSSLKTWLYRITINQCKDYLRSNYLRKIFLVGSTKEEIQEQTPETITIAKMEEQQVIDQIMGLSRKYREVMVLKYIHQLEIKEIAEIMSLSVNTIKTRIRRAKEQLLAGVKEEFLYEQ